jgi:putative DNA primase/helicase
VLNNLLGSSNTCSPSLRDLAKDFGLASMIGKQAALVGDARLTGRIDQTEMTEKLLSISGEDAVTINRKNKSHWEGRLKTRFVICTNVVPMIGDASGAIASRFVALVMKHSFLGKENHRLHDLLSEEMPGILNWAIEGLRQLQACGRIESPASARETMNELDELSSPVKAFVNERCRLAPSFRIPTKSLYEAWRQWNRDKGIDHPSSDAVFGRDLRAVEPTIKKKQYNVPNSHERQRQNYYEGITLN